jgi:hypothetical protein
VFNGYATQYKFRPVRVEPHQRIRVWVLDAGPSENSAFHIVGTIFDEPGLYPIVTHKFANVAKGALGPVPGRRRPRHRRVALAPGRRSVGRTA